MTKHVKTGREKLHRAWKEAERKGREREILAWAEQQEQLRKDAVDTGVVDEQEEKANKTGHTIVKIRTKNRARFAQVISDNVYYLLNKDYINLAELGLITALSTTLEMHSNAIVKSAGEYHTISSLALAFNYSVRHTRRLINQLIDKGIVYELVDAKSLKMYGRTIEQRPLFSNPEVVFAGDRNRINATLARIVINADHIENAGMKLPWKIWVKPGGEHAKLYKRNTYLRYRNDTSKPVVPRGTGT